jgi:hypothetical protein
MGRENFMVKLTQAKTNYPEYVMISAITRIVEVPRTDGSDKKAAVEAHTQVYIQAQPEPVLVNETAETIERKCKQISNLLYVVKQ